MVFIGFTISGIVEHGITVALSPSDHVFDVQKTKISVGNGSNERRYCDPPNLTTLAIYYAYANDEADIDDDYDFSQLEDMFFKVYQNNTFLSNNEFEKIFF